MPRHVSTGLPGDHEHFFGSESRRLCEGGLRKNRPDRPRGPDQAPAEGRDQAALLVDAAAGLVDRLEKALAHETDPFLRDGLG
jgi:hypothetical protein